MSEYTIALHGGAGTLLRENMSAEKEVAYRDALLLALREGEHVLLAGGSALDAVVRSVQALEDCPLFNAGKGAVYTREGAHELDASLMEGRERRSGAVCGLKRIANPILLCRKVMDSEFVMLNGEGAEEFARVQGMEWVDNRYFDTDHRARQLQEAKAEGKMQLDHSDKRHKYGTVGAVARDRQGNLAAATSTGGMTNKPYGRIGDSALIGSGTWADNRSCAISATGHGEFFIRTATASRIASLIEFGGLSMEEACERILNEEVKGMGGDGGLIVVGREGEPYLPFNSAGMYRAWISDGGPAYTAIFANDQRAHPKP